MGSGRLGVGANNSADQTALATASAIRLKDAVHVETDFFEFRQPPAGTQPPFLQDIKIQPPLEPRSSAAQVRSSQTASRRGNACTGRAVSAWWKKGNGDANCDQRSSGNPRLNSDKNCIAAIRRE